MSTVLTDTALAELLASSRAHGTYDEELKTFVTSGEKGIQVNLTQGTFAGKKSNSVKTGFTSAIARTLPKPDGSPGKAAPLPEGVDVAVIAKNDQVYLIRRDLVSTAAAPAAPSDEQ